MSKAAEAKRADNGASAGTKAPGYWWYAWRLIRYRPLLFLLS